MGNSVGETITKLFDTASDELRRSRFVGCVESYPILSEFEAPLAIKNYFAEHSGEFAVNDGRKIYYSRHNIAELANNSKFSMNRQEADAFLRREYSHLFLQHSRLKTFFQENDVMEKTFQIACEIDACRAEGLPIDSVCYRTSATDEAFPCTKGAKSVWDIYEALAKEYGDQIERVSEEGEQQDGGEGGGEEQSEQPQKDSQQDNEKGDSENGENQSGQRGDGDRGRDGNDGGSGDTQNGDRDSNIDREQSSRGNNSDNTDGGDGGSSDANGSLSSRADGGQAKGNSRGNPSDKQSYRYDVRADSAGNRGDRDDKGNDVTNGQENQPEPDRSKSSSQGDRGNSNDTSRYSKPKSELNDDQKDLIRKTLARRANSLSLKDGDESALQAEGMSANEGTERTETQELLDVTYQRWRNRQVKKQLAKLKSAIQGKISKRKYATYARPSRRAITSNGLLTKGKKKELVGQPAILVALDASGSMEVQDVQDLATCIGNIFEDLGRPKRGCYICMFDTEVFELKPMRKWKEVVAQYAPGGGTDYDVVLQEANRLGVDVVIEVGDGECSLDVGYGNAAKTFKERGGKWYDVLVHRKKGSFRSAWDFYLKPEHDIRTAICLDKNIARELKECERQLEKNVDIIKRWV